MKYTEWIILSAVFVMFCLFGGLVFRSIDREHDKADNAAMVAEVEQLSQKMERFIETVIRSMFVRARDLRNSVTARACAGR